MPMLQAGNFRRIARGGLGRTSLNMAQALVEFDGHLYVATSCANAQSAEDAPRILRREADGGWRVVHEASLVADSGKALVDVQLPGEFAKRLMRGSEREGSLIPAATGYRSMVVFKGASDTKPALYVSTMSFSGGLILRSEDGEGFFPVGEPGLGNAAVYSFQALTVHGGRLFAAAAGAIGDGTIDRNVPPEAALYVSDDPASGTWAPATLPGFGDAGNVAIVTLASAHGHLYAGTTNPVRGFEVWRTAAEGAAPFAWTRVIGNGAYGYNQNLTASAMAEFNGALYVGGGVTGFGHDRVYDIGPAACEVIRILPDGSWDLVAGKPRFTPDGLKVPLSMLGQGLDDPFNAMVWSLAVHDGVLYLGTHQWEAFRALELGSEDIFGGYQLWASEDGEQWSLVLEDGGGHPAEVGLRTLVSTSQGLALGTCNQMQLLSFMARLRGRQLDLPDRRGFEVLLGTG